VRDAAFECQRGVVVTTLVPGKIAVRCEVFAAPVEVAHNFTGIGVQQQFTVVKAMPVVGSPRAMRAQAVHQAGLRAWQVTVPDINGMARERQARQFVLAVGVEQAQLHGFGVA